MKTKADYVAALNLVKEVLREWDPYLLVVGGAPQDEFDGEAARVVTYIPRMHTAHDAAAALSEVFSVSFELKGFSPSDCADVGHSLFGRLVKAGLIHAQPTVQADAAAPRGVT